MSSRILQYSAPQTCQITGVMTATTNCHVRRLSPNDSASLTHDILNRLILQNYSVHTPGLRNSIRTRVQNDLRQRRWIDISVEISLSVNYTHTTATSWMNARGACAMCQTPTHVMNERKDDKFGRVLCRLLLMRTGTPVVNKLYYSSDFWKLNIYRDLRLTMVILFPSFCCRS